MINSLPISRKLLFVDINKEISIDECFAYLKKIFPSSVIISTDKIKEKHSNYVNYSYNNINHLLGSSINFVILDQRRLNIDNILSCIGAIHHNGTIIVLLDTDTLKETSQYYCNYLLSQITYFSFNLQSWLDFINNNEELQSIKAYATKPPTTPPISYDYYSCTNILLNHEQSNIKKQILSNLKDKVVSYNLITGNRGTGKTTLTVDIIKELIADNHNVSLIISPNKHLHQIYDIKDLQIFTVDTIDSHTNITEILFIEEASSIPVHKINHILNLFKKIVFITTTDGYEGNSQGFKINIVDKYNINSFILHQRYRNNYDAVEMFLNTISFQSDTRENIKHNANNKDQALRNSDICELSTYRCELLKPYKLLNNNDINILIKLNQLLKENHYQHSCNDIIRWFSPQCEISVLIDNNNEIVAFMILSLESLQDYSLAIDVFNAIRQPKNNLLIQTLITHVGLLNCYKYYFFRIERIVTIPSLRRNGLASKLVAQTEKIIKERSNTTFFSNTPFIGVACALKEDNFKFWTYNQYIPISIGLTVDNASGMRSIIFIKELDKNNCAITKNLQFLQARLDLLTFRHQMEYERNILKLPDVINNKDLMSLLKYLNSFNNNLCTDKKNKRINDFDVIKLEEIAIKLLPIEHILQVIKSIAYFKHSIEHALLEIIIYMVVTNIKYRIDHKVYNILYDFILEKNTTNTLNKYKLSSKKNLDNFIRIKLKDLLEKTWKLK